ncbi:hypothetical protein [Pseudonocardia sp. ICBG1293]|uniref:hypothetical protein n=1 Tax=Pseudonocardia sp. ICBG1293 TaxID=2844382 RepID=UPI001CCD0CC1|nr:hypothetical protein [Pseudonocardia sp. ICBG1293]
MPSFARVRRERAGGAGSGASGPGRVRAVVLLAALCVLSSAGCASTVAGTPWPAGQGPALPESATSAQGTTVAPTRRPPTSFTVPGPLSGAPPAGSDGRSTTTVPPVPVSPVPPEGADAPAVTVPPVPVGDGAAPVPEGRARPAPGSTGAATRPARPAAAAAPLTADVLDDECLLDAASLTGLLGGPPVAPAANAVVTRADGTRTRACFALADGVTVSVNAYTTNRGTPGGYVAAARHGTAVTRLPAGTSATVLDTVAGPTLQLATTRYLLTVAVAGRTPTPEQWRAAAVAVAAAAAR